jgi:DNA-binding LacI/PurR family transcriptional regulator
MPDDPAKNGKPLKTQLSDQLRSEIASGAYAPGSVIESERELCEKNGVSRVTVRAALDILEDEGLIKRYPHRGAVVSTLIRQTRKSPALGRQPRFLLIRWSDARTTIQEFSLGFQQACRQLNIEAQIFEAHESQEDFFHCLKCLAPQADAVILEPIDETTPDQLAAITPLAKKTIIASTTRFAPHVPIHTIGADDAAGGYLATDHLLRLYRRPVYHLGGSREIASASRLRGWKRAMIGHGHDDWQPYFFDDPGDPYAPYATPDYDPTAFGQVAAEQIFAHDPPIAGGYSIFTVNDCFARGVYRAAKKHQLHIGRDVHVVGFGDYPYAATLNPPLSSIRLDNQALAAVKLLRQLYQNPPTRPLRQIVPVQLIERASSLGLPPTTSPTAEPHTA